MSTVQLHECVETYSTPHNEHVHAMHEMSMITARYSLTTSLMSKHHEHVNMSRPDSPKCSTPEGSRIMPFVVINHRVDSSRFVVCRN